MPYRGSIDPRRLALFFVATEVDAWVLGGLVHGAKELTLRGSKLSHPRVSERRHLNRKRKGPSYSRRDPHSGVVLRLDFKLLMMVDSNVSPVWDRRDPFLTLEYSASLRTPSSWPVSCVNLLAPGSQLVCCSVNVEAACEKALHKRHLPASGLDVVSWTLPCASASSEQHGS